MRSEKVSSRLIMPHLLFSFRNGAVWWLVEQPGQMGVRVLLINAQQVAWRNAIDTQYQTVRYYPSLNVDNQQVNSLFNEKYMIKLRQIFV